MDIHTDMEEEYPKWVKADPALCQSPEYGTLGSSGSIVDCVSKVICWCRLQANCAKVCVFIVLFCSDNLSDAQFRHPVSKAELSQSALI